MQGFEFRIEVNLDAMTHLRIWKPIMKNASTLAEKISMEVTQDLYKVFDEDNFSVSWIQKLWRQFERFVLRILIIAHNQFVDPRL
ncbi:hypothetical protein CMV_022077 [Castanea mollissima]|uniref:Uncharacterized protein n=1 Tax=Castanea mollissima TaxID=60419 RepID=A0A8J4QIL6_9ROSI|nr:hypothetical protein CMV_022077 [Castanea mollissima]